MIFNTGQPAQSAACRATSEGVEVQGSAKVRGPLPSSLPPAPPLPICSPGSQVQPEGLQRAGGGGMAEGLDAMSIWINLHTETS